jgi:hypothetical protein
VVLGSMKARMGSRPCAAPPSQAARGASGV